jgi:hypothetical protein
VSADVGFAFENLQFEILVENLILLCLALKRLIVMISMLEIAPVFENRRG